MRYCFLNTPVGNILIAGTRAGLRYIYFEFEKNQIPVDWVEDSRFFKSAIDQLTSYFKGRLTQFDLKLDLQAAPFQKQVLTSLQTVGYGQTISYGELAKKIGNPKASRAVGMANARNPLPIVIPCHRVIGADGKLVGYGGGLKRKQILLDLEQGILPEFSQ